MGVGPMRDGGGVGVGYYEIKVGGEIGGGGI